MILRFLRGLLGAFESSPSERVCAGCGGWIGVNMTAQDRWFALATAEAPEDNVMDPVVRILRVPAGRPAVVTLDPTIGPGCAVPLEAFRLNGVPLSPEDVEDALSNHVHSYLTPGAIVETAHSRIYELTGPERRCGIGSLMWVGHSKAEEVPQ